MLFAVAALLLLAGTSPPSDSARAQQVLRLSGIIKNAETGEPLPGAAVSVREIPAPVPVPLAGNLPPAGKHPPQRNLADEGIQGGAGSQPAPETPSVAEPRSASGVQRVSGTVSNADGSYALALPPGIYQFVVQYLGFLPLTDTLVLGENRTKNFLLEPDPIRVDEVVVTAGERPDENLSSTEMGLTVLDARGFRSVPVLFGEKDPLKTLQLLPGLKSGREGSTGLHARGGAADQNLVLLDDAPVYNSSHLLGFVSVFNPDAIKEVRAITGGIPAEYGGRLSSIIDIHTSNGNPGKFGGSAGIGLIASHLMVEGPLGSDAGSFTLSGRRTYADLFLKLSSNPATRDTRLYFYDLNLKASYGLGSSDRLFLTGYTGKDHFAYPEVFGYAWGTSIAALRWDHLFSRRLSASTSFTYSNYGYLNSEGSGPGEFIITSGIRDLQFKADFTAELDSSNSLKFGLLTIAHLFQPGTAAPGPQAPPVASPGAPRQYALEHAAYLSHETSLSRWLKVQYGLRTSLFGLEGTSYAALEPRLALNIRLDKSSAFKASYTRTAQYLHMVSSSTVTNPNDLWLPSSGSVRPQYADQVSAGYFRNFDGNELQTSVEVYYKNMQNLVEYRDGADFLVNPNIALLLLTGRGWSYGAEFLVRKKFGKLTGWLAYTWSRTLEQFDGIDGGRAFPARHDRPHDLSVVAAYELNARWQFSATWVWYSGNAVTFPNSFYHITWRVIPYYTERNGYRMPSYHRLDVSASYHFSEKASLNLSVYNAYNRSNPYAIMFRANPDEIRKTEAVQVTLFPIIPSLTYNHRF